MGRRKKDEAKDDSLKVNEEREFTYPGTASRIRITGPLDQELDPGEETDVTTYRMVEHNEQSGLTWSFKHPGKYLVRYMDEYGVEHGTEEITVK